MSRACFLSDPRRVAACFFAITQYTYLAHRQCIPMPSYLPLFSICNPFSIISHFEIFLPSNAEYSEFPSCSACKVIAEELVRAGHKVKHIEASLISGCACALGVFASLISITAGFLLPKPGGPRCHTCTMTCIRLSTSLRACCFVK